MWNIWKIYGKICGKCGIYNIIYGKYIEYME